MLKGVGDSYPHPSGRSSSHQPSNLGRSPTAVSSPVSAKRRVVGYSDAIQRAVIELGIASRPIPTSATPSTTAGRNVGLSGGAPQPSRHQPHKDMRSVSAMSTGSNPYDYTAAAAGEHTSPFDVSVTELETMISTGSTILRRRANSSVTSSTALTPIESSKRLDSHVRHSATVDDDALLRDVSPPPFFAMHHQSVSSAVPAASKGGTSLDATASSVSGLDGVSQLHSTHVFSDRGDVTLQHHVAADEHHLVGGEHHHHGNIRSTSATWEPSWTALVATPNQKSTSSHRPTGGFSSKHRDVQPPQTPNAAPKPMPATNTPPPTTSAAGSASSSLKKDSWQWFCNLAKVDGLTQTDLELVSATTLRAIMARYQITDPATTAQIEASWALLQLHDSTATNGKANETIPATMAVPVESAWADGSGRQRSPLPAPASGRGASPSYFTSSASRDRSPSAAFSYARSPSSLRSSSMRITGTTTTVRSGSAATEWDPVLHPKDMDLRLTVATEPSPAKRMSVSRRSLLARETVCTADPNLVISPQPIDRARGLRSGFAHAVQTFHVNVHDSSPPSSSKFSRHMQLQPSRMHSAPRDNLFGGQHVVPSTAEGASEAANTHRRIAKGPPPPEYTERTAFGIRTAGFVGLK